MMIKRHSIVIYAIATAMGLGLMAAAGAQNRPAASLESNVDPVKLITLKLTFADEQWARVAGFDGGTIRIEHNGNTFALTPHVINKRSRTIELKVSRIVPGMDGESLQAVETLAVGNDPTKLDVNGISFTVQAKKIRKVSPGIQTTATRQCCVTDCEGRLICGVCVCTPCGVCAAYNWCDCALPGPVD
jgi:hypothetical protein